MLHVPRKEELSVSLGQVSFAGRKPVNQDFFGAIVPDGQALRHKGIVLAIADGISSSPVSAVASKTAVKSFLTDYYCTSDAWSAKTAGARVISATNAWLNAQNHAYEDRNHAHVTTFSALVLKGHRAHVFHVGDSRVWRLSGDTLEPLTEDHRLVLSERESYLSRALGIAASVEIDYRAVDLHVGGVFVLTTDGVHEHISRREMARIIGDAETLDAAAASIAAAALDHGSADNLTVQIVRVDAAPAPGSLADLVETNGLQPAPLPPVPSEFDGYRILREIHASARSHICLAIDGETGGKVALKFPGSDVRENEILLRRFATEEWIARRVTSQHVLKALPAHDSRRTLYTVSEFIDGQTLRQWMQDTPERSLARIRSIVTQIAIGLEAFHRKDMIHQDLRPENIMIDADGTVKIIDFGAVCVAGLAEAAPEAETGDILGTHQYAAPEYFLGHAGTPASDLFSLGVIAFELMTGRLPYGDRLARAGSVRAQAAVRYTPAKSLNPAVPDWVDHALKQAVSMSPARRQHSPTEFAADLGRPAAGFAPGAFVPLAERDPVLFWKTLSGILALVIAALVFFILASL